MSDIKTTRWELVSWICPRCGDEELPTMLQPVDSRDMSIDSRDIWEPDYDPELYKKRNLTEPIVACTECNTVFDVSLSPRSE